MKSLISIATLTLALLPIAAGAQYAVQGTTNNGNFINQGALTSSNANPIFFPVVEGEGFTLNFNIDRPNVPFLFDINTNTNLLGTVTTQSGGSPPVGGPAEISVYGLRMICTPYNAAFVGNGLYPYNTETDGIFGGVVTIAEFTPAGVENIIGTITVPNSPHGGPYLNRFVTNLSSAFVPTYGSIISAWISSVNAGPSQGYQGCLTSLYLESATQG